MEKESINKNVKLRAISETEVSEPEDDQKRVGCTHYKVNSIIFIFSWDFKEI